MWCDAGFLLFERQTCEKDATTPDAIKGVSFVASCLQALHSIGFLPAFWTIEHPYSGMCTFTPLLKPALFCLSVSVHVYPAFAPAFSTGVNAPHSLPPSTSFPLLMQVLREIDKGGEKAFLSVAKRKSSPGIREQKPSPFILCSPPNFHQKRSRFQERRRRRRD